MNNKILIGSIIAVVILLLVSFTGVVGYQTTKSSTIARASPLFSIRTKRAIDEESKDLTCDYVGKGNTMSFPARNSRTALYQKVMDRISRMDDNVFNKFIELVVYRIRQDETVKDFDTQEITIALQVFRDNPNEIASYIKDYEWPVCCGYLSNWGREIPLLSTPCSVIAAHDSFGLAPSFSHERSA